jgi:hypothetical protein
MSRRCARSIDVAFAVASRSGAGSTFQFRIPAARVATALDPLPACPEPGRRSTQEHHA